MFDQKTLLTILMILLILFLLIGILRENDSFYLLVKGSEESEEDLEEEPAKVDLTIPTPQEFLQEQYNYILYRILEELDAGNNTYIPSFPERLHRATLLRVLGEVESKGYGVTTETNKEGHVSRVTFTPQLSPPSDE